MSGETGQKWDGNAHSSALLNVASNEGPALLRKLVLVRLVLGWQLVSKLNYRAIGRSENPGGGALSVEMGFTWTFPRNQDATVKLKPELISIKF